MRKMSLEELNPSCLFISKVTKKYFTVEFMQCSVLNKIRVQEERARFLPLSKSYNKKEK